MPGRDGDVISRNSYVYVKNNPLKYVDPDGMDPKKKQEESWYTSAWNSVKDFAVDTANNFVDLVGGTSYSIMDNYSYGLYSKLNQAPKSTAGQIGVSIGNGLTYISSGLEMLVGGATTVGGAGITGGGLVLCPVTAGGGCAVAAGGTGVAVEGLALTTHGGSVMYYTSTKDNAGGSSGGSSNSKAEKISPNELKPTETPDPSKVKNLENSMEKNGFYSSKPVKYYEYEGEKYIVDGHHRTEAAKNLGLDVYAKSVDESYFANRWGATASDFIDKILNFSK